MIFQNIICQDNILQIRKQDALKIELTINLLPDIDYWKDIGDKLYNFHAKNQIENINVNKKQFIFLKYLFFNLK